MFVLEGRTRRSPVAAAAPVLYTIGHGRDVKKPSVVAFADERMAYGFKVLLEMTSLPDRRSERRPVVGEASRDPAVPLLPRPSLPPAEVRVLAIPDPGNFGRRCRLNGLGLVKVEADGERIHMSDCDARFDMDDVMFHLENVAWYF